jgi:hypothetical protein
MWIKIFFIAAIVGFFCFLPYIHRTSGSIGLGIESVYDDTIWMGWTIYESGNVGYAQAGGDGGKAYGRYQFDYRYALHDFIGYVLAEDPEKYSMLSRYASYAAGSEYLLSSAGLGIDWVRAYNADPEAFSRLQDEFAYQYYYIPAKTALLRRGIDLDGIDDPVVKGTVYSLAIRDGANDSGVRAAWQSYSAGGDVRTWLEKIYELETSRHPSQSNRWNQEQKVAALNGGVTTGILGNLGTMLAANGAVYTDYVKAWMEQYPELSKPFVDAGGWSADNKEWAQAIRGAGDWYELYGIRGGSLDFSYATGAGMYIDGGYADGVVVNAQSLSIPDNGSSMPIVYLAQSGNQPWSNVAFGGGTISSSGCSVTSLAMVLSYLKGNVHSENWIYPNEIVSAIANRYGNYNYFYAGNGQSWDIFPAVADLYGVRCNAISSSSILRELSAGHPVIMSCKPSEFTSTGHFIVLTGLSSDGYILVNDPNAAHAAYSYKKYPVSYLVSCGKGWWSFS